MKPPYCVICKKMFNSNKGGLVRFKLSKEDEEFNKRFDEPGFVGHPRGLEWFCENHIELERSFSSLLWEDAKVEIEKCLNDE